MSFVVGAVAIALTACTTTVRASVTPNGTQLTAESDGGSLSRSGRYVAFWSFADDLVSGDTNNLGDAFVRDMQTGSVERVSVATDGTQANDEGHAAVWMTPDARYVAFESLSENLDPSATQTPGPFKIYVHDRTTGITKAVSLGPGATSLAHDSFFDAFTNDEQHVVFSSGGHIYLGSVNGGTAADQGAPALTNVCPAGTSTDVRSLRADAQLTKFVSVVMCTTTSGSGNAMLVLTPMPSGANNVLATAPALTFGGIGLTSPFGGGPAISQDGSVIAWGENRSDGGGSSELRAWTANGGAQALSPGPEGLGYVSLSADGRYIGFNRTSPGTSHSDGFVYDRTTGVTGTASVALSGEANGDTFNIAFSGDDSLVAFWSAATNLVANDTNGTYDVFTRPMRDIITAP